MPILAYFGVHFRKNAWHSYHCTGLSNLFKIIKNILGQQIFFFLKIDPKNCFSPKKCLDPHFFLHLKKHSLTPKLWIGFILQCLLNDPWLLIFNNGLSSAFHSNLESINYFTMCMTLFSRRAFSTWLFHHLPLHIIHNNWYCQGHCQRITPIMYPCQLFSCTF